MRWPAASIGLAVLLLVRWLIRVLGSEDLEQGDEWRYDVSRINELRRIDPFYRVFQPAIQLLARFNRGACFARACPRSSARSRPPGCRGSGWPRSTWAGARLIALFAAPLLRLLASSTWFGLLGCWWPRSSPCSLTAWLLRRRLAVARRRRLRLIKRRMPFLLDLLTLLMEAGSTFLGALTPGRRGVPGPPGGRGVRPRADRHEPGQDPRPRPSRPCATGSTTTRSPASSARSCRARAWARRWPTSFAPRPTCCG